VDKLGNRGRCGAMLVKLHRRDHRVDGHFGGGSDRPLVVDRKVGSGFFAIFSRRTAWTKLSQFAVVRQAARFFDFRFGDFDKGRCEGPSGLNIGEWVARSHHALSRRIIQLSSECSLNVSSRDNYLESVKTVSNGRLMLSIEEHRRDHPALVQWVCSVMSNISPLRGLLLSHSLSDQLVSNLKGLIA
jgi:hypothetical protein